MAAQSTEQENNTSLTWNAPERPFKKRSRDFYITIISIASLFGLVLFIIEGFMPVLLIIGLVFLMYVLFTVEPANVDYEISDLGIKVAGGLTEWPFLGRFWFVERFGGSVLVIEKYGFPGRMELVIKPELKEKILQKMSEYLPHEEVSPSFLDKTVVWASKKLPNS